MRSLPRPHTAPEGTLMSFTSLQRSRSRGFGHSYLAARALPFRADHGPATPVTFRPQRFSRSRRLTPHNPVRACFIPVTLLGFRLQGFDPPRGAAPLSRPPAFLPFGPLGSPQSDMSELRLQSLHPPEESALRRTEIPLQPWPSWRCAPLRLSLLPARVEICACAAFVAQARVPP
jgi:hypothetical protein